MYIHISSKLFFHSYNTDFVHLVYNITSGTVTPVLESTHDDGVIISSKPAKSGVNRVEKTKWSNTEGQLHYFRS